MNELNLAIEMWEGIKKHITEHPSATEEDIERAKHNFCEHHGLLWTNDCWFCTYKECDTCPLYKLAREQFPHTRVEAGCVDFWIVTDQVAGSDEEHFTLEERLVACDNIINALKKEAGKNTEE